MPKDQPGTEEIYAAAIPNQLELTLAANRLCTSDNPYEVRNQIILQEKKRQILYKNGVTLPAKAETLQHEAARKIRHARKLAANMHRADPSLRRHPDADAHHIVAAQDVRAGLARMILFNEGVGINDYANGCYTKRKKQAMFRISPTHHRMKIFILICIMLQCICVCLIQLIKERAFVGKFCRELRLKLPLELSLIKWCLR